MLREWARRESPRRVPPPPTHKPTTGTIAATDENPLKGDGPMVYQSLQADHYLDGPDYAELGKPFGLPGQRVERPSELPGAIRTAMREVEGGKTAILNIALSH